MSVLALRGRQRIVVVFLPLFAIVLVTATVALNMDVKRATLTVMGLSYPISLLTIRWARGDDLGAQTP